MKNKETIEKFYACFAKGDAEGMVALYHDDVVFKDPAFGKLMGTRAKAMWRMLLSRNAADTKISCNRLEGEDTSVNASWTAEYTYGEKQRRVINEVLANFKFQDGKIIEHTDKFDLWKWSSQALGLSGYLLGWTSFMRNKIQQTTNQKLDAFMGIQDSKS